MLKNNLEKLEQSFGSAKKVAEALGYTERRYRDFKSGAAPIPKAVKLAIEKLLDNFATGRDAT